MTEPSRALRAAVGALASVRPQMRPEVAALSKALGALCAGERLLACVDPSVDLEVAHLEKALRALGATVGSLAGVNPEVDPEVAAVREPFRALGANEWSLPGVRTPMYLEVAFPHEALPALRAAEGLLFGFGPLLPPEGGRRPGGEDSGTLVALRRFLAGCQLLCPGPGGGGAILGTADRWRALPATNRCRQVAGEGRPEKRARCPTEPRVPAWTTFGSLRCRACKMRRIAEQRHERAAVVQGSTGVARREQPATLRGQVCAVKWNR